jgi:alpha-amylase/alpha-mannosidase (GH57 family)
VIHPVAIHGHFYQPPREDPFTGQMPREAGAEPYHDYNEKITAECYLPNAAAGNLDRISFNFGPTLISWLARHQPETYARVLEADRVHRQAHGVGNAIAQTVHHTVLPLARRRDKRLQVKWGIASFTQRFQRQPRGLWLPEMAVDLTTLEILAEHGLSFTILSEEQVRGELRDGAGPYRVRLPGGGYFGVFVRDRHLSNHVSFDTEHIADAPHWLVEHVRNRRGLTLIATDGETFGHHQPRGAQFLAELLCENETYRVVALTDYLRAHPPTTEIDIVERTAWSCPHHLARWDTGCVCTSGDHSWKPILRGAMDFLADEIDALYQYELRNVLADPWLLVDRYIDVVMGVTNLTTLLHQQTAATPTTGQLLRIHKLVQAHLHRQRMFSSCGWFFDKLDRPEPRYVLAQAMRAIQLVKQATGDDLGPAFRRSLSAPRVAHSRSSATAPLLSPPLTAVDLYDEIAAAHSV